MAESPYNSYPAQDGFIAIVASSDEQWDRLLVAVGRPELVGDERYATLKARVQRMDDVDAIVEGFTRKRTRDAAFSTLIAAGVTCAPVRDIGEVVNDPHMLERGALKWVDHPLYGRVPLPRSPLRFSSAPLPEIEPSGEAGRDNDLVYGEWLGLGEAGVAELVRKQAI